MPRYTYTAKSQPGTIVTSEIEAASEQDAIRKLGAQGLFPLKITDAETQAAAGAVMLRRKVSAKEVASFTRQLSTLVGSGVNIISGLSIVVKQTRNPYLKSVLKNTAASIRDGKPLSESLAAHPSVFPPLYCSMVRTAEVSGALNKVLDRLADFLERDDEFRESIIASLAYPLFIMAVGVITVGVLLVFVIPKMVAMFQDLGQTLPLPTMILINISSFARDYWWLLAAAAIALVVTLRQFPKSAAGSRIFSVLALKLPVLGTISLKAEISRLTRTLSLLLSSGIPITQALEVASSVLQNYLIKREAAGFREQISAGASFSSAIRSSGLFPEFVTNIISVGEETGSLDVSLMRISESYEKDVERMMKALSRLLEPVMILIMGLIVGFIVMAMLLPIFEINIVVR